MNKRKQLNKEFKYKGAISLRYKNECIGMLPEIHRLKAYEEEKCSSIYEYAAKFAGISNAQVDNVIRLERRLHDKPALKEALVTGAASHNKITRVISIATKENDEEMAQRVNTNSRVALDIFVKDYKNEDGLSKPESEGKSLSVQTFMPDINILEHLSIKLQKDLIERYKKGININKLLMELLQKHDRDIENEMREIGEQSNPTKSSYIKAKTQNVLTKKYGTKCVIPGCNKEAEQTHHQLYASRYKTHDPRYMIPMCRGHHEITHTKDLIYLKMRRKAEA